MPRKPKKKAPPKLAFSAADLMARAESYVEAMDLETAAKYYDRAISLVRGLF
jgi:hypothetical protein